MPRVVANDESFERPFRFSGYVEYGVRFHQVRLRQGARVAHRERHILRGWRENPPDIVVGEAAHRPARVLRTGAVRKNFCRRVTDIDMDEACRERVVETA